VLATQPSVLREGRAVAAIGALIVLAALQYAYPVWRTLDPSTPYLSEPVNSLSGLIAYATGASFHGSMLAFTPGQLLHERLPLFLRHLWGDCALLLPAAVVGAVSFKDRVAAGFLALALVGHLAFALSYAIDDIDVYFVPAYVITAVVAGVGLERVLGWPYVRRVPALACILLPLALGLQHRKAVVAASGREMAQPMRELLEHVNGRALIVARYNDYMYLLYYRLIEGLGAPAVYVGNEITAAEIVAYLQARQPVYLAPLRRWAPVGLPVYSTRLELRPELKSAGLSVTMAWPGLYRVDLSPLAGAP
jgi:hypothetical protein